MTPILRRGSNERRSSDTARRYSSMMSKAAWSTSTRRASGCRSPDIRWWGRRGCCAHGWGPATWSTPGQAPCRPGPTATSAGCRAGRSGSQDEPRTSTRRPRRSTPCPARLPAKAFCTRGVGGRGGRCGADQSFPAPRRCDRGGRGHGRSGAPTHRRAGAVADRAPGRRVRDPNPAAAGRRGCRWGTCHVGRAGHHKLVTRRATLIHITAVSTRRWQERINSPRSSSVRSLRAHGCHRPSGQRSDREELANNRRTGANRP